MKRVSGALNNKGYSENLKHGDLPALDHITYSGTFNSHYYRVGRKAEQLQEVYLGYGSSKFETQVAKQISESIPNDHFLGIFLKSNKDGQPRTDTPLQLVVVLDISGSMSSSISLKQSASRLSLSIQAIKLLFDKLRLNDLFSLVTFNNDGYTEIPLDYVQNQSKELIHEKLSKLNAKGGTTIVNGFEQGITNMNLIKPPYQTEKRIVMLTDVGDNSLSSTEQFLSAMQSKGVHTTIIGISDEFISSTCEQLTNVRGFNYFCAVEDSDLIKHIVDNFDFTFFPCYFDEIITLECPGILSIEVFGTPDSDKVKYYQNEQMKEKNQFIVTKTLTAFPSPLELDNNQNIQQEGGLILVKMKLDPQVEQLKGKIQMTCKSLEGQDFSNQQEFVYPIQQQQYFTCQAMLDGINSYFLVDRVKNLIKIISNLKTKLDIELKQKFLQELMLLEKIAPSQNKEDIKNLVKVLERF